MTTQSDTADDSDTADRELRQRLHRMGALLEEIDSQKESAAKSRTREIVQTLMDFHGAGLARLLAHLAASGEEGQALVDSLAQDELIASLLLLYGLHPIDFKTRVRQALEKVHPYIHSHGGNVELLNAEDGVVRLRLQGSCKGCPSSAITLKQTIEEAIRELAPDLVNIEVEADSGSGAMMAAIDASRHALPILAG